MTLTDQPIIESTLPAVDGNSVWPWVDPIAPLGDAAPGGRPWPSISIVTPNYNYASLIETTIRSVLAQQYPNLQYIIIDGGSTDASCDIIAKYQSRLGYFECQPDAGQYAAITKGFAHATGEVCGWINSDDLYLPWTLRAVGAIFAAFPQVQWITGHPAHMQAGTVYAVQDFIPYPRELIRAGLFHGGNGGVGWIQQESCFWRRSLWEKVGGLDPSLRYAADFDLWTRFAEHADLYAVSTLLGGFSIRGRQNRSIANREPYMNEIYGIADQLAQRTDTHQVSISRGIETFRKLRRYPLVRGVARKLLGIDTFSGPTLQWDFEQSLYRIQQRALFDR